MIFLLLLVILVSAIKVINYLSLHHLLQVHLIYKLFTQMFGVLPLYQMITLNTMLSLSITSPNMSGYIHFKRNLMSDVFVRFKDLVENYFSSKIIQIYYDNSGEFLALKDYFALASITHLTTPPHTPKHNGYSKRHHRHIVKTRLILFHHASIPTSFWPFAF